MAILDVFIILCIWGFIYLISVGRDAWEDSYNYDIKVNYNKAIEEYVDLRWELENITLSSDRSKSKKDRDAITGQIVEDMKELGDNLDVTYDGRVDYKGHLDRGVYDRDNIYKYLLWLYLSQYGHIDPEYHCLYSRNICFVGEQVREHPFEGNGFYLDRYIRVMWKIEKNIQKFYPDQHLVFLENGEETPEGKLGYFKWEAGVYREERLIKKYRLWDDDTIPEISNLDLMREYLDIKLQSRDVEYFLNEFNDNNAIIEEARRLGDDKMRKFNPLIKEVRKTNAGVNSLGYHPRQKYLYDGEDDEYFVWEYCAKKGKIFDTCGSPDDGTYVDWPINQDSRYIEVMKFVEKAIQEKYPKQRLMYVATCQPDIDDVSFWDGFEAKKPDWEYKGHIIWEAFIDQNIKNKALFIKRPW